MMIRVAHVLYSYLPTTQNWIYTQLRCNRSCSHTVISLMAENLTEFPWKPRYTRFERRSLVDLLRLLLARYWILQPERFYRSVVGAVRPDIFHGHFAHESWRVLGAARAAGVPLVTTLYGVDVDKLPRKRFWRKRYPKLFDYGSYFIVEGPFMGKRLAAAGCPEEKIRIVPLGINPDLFGASVPASEGQTEKEVRVLFAGLSREKKGPVDAAIVFREAAKADPRLTLHCIGDGPYRPVVSRILERAGLRDRVTFHGYLSFETYRNVLAGSDIVLTPSCFAADGDSEGGAPVVCIEALAAGKPVIGTRHCDIPFVVNDGKTGLLADEHDTAAMAGNLLQLAGNPELRMRMGEAGRKHAAKQHDSCVQVEKITAVYREALRRTGEGEAV